MSEPTFINRDEEHLRLLSIFHYVCAGMVGLFACLPIIHLVVGLFLVTNPNSFPSGVDEPRLLIGWFFVAISAVFIVTGWTLAALLAWGGRCLQKRKHHLPCLIVACLACFFMPFGTVLGVFSILVLIRPSIKALFELQPRPTRSP